MATIEENKKAWGGEWKDRGDDWSQAWGGPESQWFGTIYPRIHSFLPGDTILEVAPGFGRWTQYLVQHCNHLIVVDLVEKCIQFCKERFRSHSHISYHVNDGKSLAMVEDNSIDFVFSFDSLVHAENDVIEVYLQQLAKKLKPNGVGFIHHSNLGMYVDPSTKKLPPNLKNLHWRTESMTAKLFEELCRDANMRCISQETINWGDSILNDCFSLFTPCGSRWERANVIHSNGMFMDEAEARKCISPLYMSFLSEVPSRGVETK